MEKVEGDDMRRELWMRLEDDFGSVEMIQIGIDEGSIRFDELSIAPESKLSLLPFCTVRYGGDVSFF